MTPPPSTAGTGPGLALVVFTGEADLKWLNVLKPGFRHCFAALESGSRWVIYNPLSHRTEIIVVGTEDVFRLTHYYREQGLDMVPWVTQPPPPKPAPWAPYTCVEAIKRVLGIHTPRVITPWNLYSFLKKYNN